MTNSYGDRMSFRDFLAGVFELRSEIKRGLQRGFVENQLVTVWGALGFGAATIYQRLSHREYFLAAVSRRDLAATYASYSVRNNVIADRYLLLAGILMIIFAFVTLLCGYGVCVIVRHRLKPYDFSEFG